ncbi:MAG: glycoside hydrolase family 27 protein [Nocardia sp.]|nr:glycoside hydrolase family 27 protein [Nocardia sp.]
MSVFAGGCASAPTATMAPFPGDAADPAISAVAALPPMGWNSWNTYGCTVDESQVRAQADAIVASGMREAGYQYVTVDDCWFDPQRGQDGNLRAAPARFPSGMRALADYVHSRNLKFGIYESPNTKTCAQYGGVYPGSTGSSGHEQADARLFASWGVDYLKYDWCSPNGNVGDQERQFTAMRDALRETGRPIVYSINPNSAVAGTPPGWRYNWAGIGSMARATQDVVAMWNQDDPVSAAIGVGQAISQVASLGGRSRAGYWTDPDMLVIGCSSIAGDPYPGLTENESRTQLAMWAMMSAPLIAGNDTAHMPERVRALLTDRAVIAVDQDPNTRAGAPISDKRHDVWVKKLADGSVAVALYNDSPSDRRIEVDRSAVGAVPADRYTVTDLWTGARSAGTWPLGATVGAHDTLMLRLEPAQ